jgi:phage terminase small subunit
MVTVANPLDRIVTKKIATVNAIGSQFGWSPVSRLKLLAIAQGKTEEENDFDEFR